MGNLLVVHFAAGVASPQRHPTTGIAVELRDKISETRREGSCEVARSGGSGKGKINRGRQLCAGGANVMDGAVVVQPFDDPQTPQREQKNGAGTLIGSMVLGQPTHPACSGVVGAGRVWTRARARGPRGTAAPRGLSTRDFQAGGFQPQRHTQVRHNATERACVRAPRDRTVCVHGDSEAREAP
jgi:hypothetical protein